jgi:putative Mg2+ transporter-C (MgtC) family protein
VLAAAGNLLFAVIGTVAVVGTHLLLRPLGRLIDRDQHIEEDEPQSPYQVQVICRPKSEKYLRAQIVQHTAGNDLVLRGIHTGPAAGDNIALTASMMSDNRAPARLERLVGELSLQPGVYAVHWHAEDQLVLPPSAAD